ncbi:MULTISPECIES: Hsp70 family protein [Gordonia]|uniref:Hsp70 family protein n=1 Tax=Gordonia TaxID=2053 RepID=UPI00071C5218|nr:MULTISPECIES: Hsp70 family protein [unclassified Gordonia (in: high G+C Gram-positive bacteria)]KSU55590.1 molecular chaperone DnaK [Gordonia sp. SGD-V-85]MCR8899841.1 Hsp70 family protein [Gordonia sp. GONU]OLT52931.1 molecular chaperone DnaK [Gordonia sp. CNJ-863]SCC50946.1 Hsp70 protein [Gordonia sp. v-85]
MTSATQTSAPHAWSLAIDFGTSNSAAAHSGATSRSIEALALTHASNLMPSAVFVDTAGTVLVGGAALNSAAQNPAGFIASPKRLIGAQPAVAANGHTLPIYALVAAVMRTIIGRGVAAHAGTMPDRVVLTHPEAWAPQQIQVLTDAARAAGIPAERITTISEPRAAAGHYSRSHALQHGTRIAVFDFGGGTLDIAVLEVTPTNTFQVIAARGDNGLGGKNFDALLQRWVEDRLADRDPDHAAWLRRTAPIDAIQSLQDSIQQAKELLSETPSATISVPGPSERTTLQITRDEFDELITPAVDAAVQLTRTTLADAGLTHPDQLTALYLTGGSSRIPLIQQRLGELGPVATLDDPKTVVAQGALLTVLADSAPTQPRGIPEAADLMPTWHTQPRTLRSPAQPTSSRRRWLRIGAAAVAVIAAAAIVTTIVTTASGSDDDPTDAPQATQTLGTDTTAAGPTGEDGGPILTDPDQIRQQLPGALQSQITDCTNGSFTDNGALKLDCTLNENGTFSGLKIAGGLSPSLRIHINVDDNEAAREVRNLRNGVYSAGKGTVVEDTNRQAAAEIAPSLSDNEYDISYANTGTGVILSVAELSSVENARTFLTRSGLIN